MVLHICLHTFLHFCWWFQTFFFNLGSGNLGCMKPVKVSSCKVMHYVVVSHMFWCSTLKIGEDETVLMSKGFNWETLGFEWLERIKMHVWSSWLFMLVVHTCLCLFLIDEYHVSCTGEMFHLSYWCSSWPFREMCSFPREMSESWVIRWNSVDLTGSYCWWFRNPANQLRLVAYPIIYRVLWHIPGGCLGFLNSMRIPTLKPLDIRSIHRKKVVKPPVKRTPNSTSAIQTETKAGLICCQWNLKGIRS